MKHLKLGDLFQSGPYWFCVLKEMQEECATYERWSCISWDTLRKTVYCNDSISIQYSNYDKMYIQQSDCA